MENKQRLWNRFFPCGIGSCRAELLSEGPRTDPLLFRLLAERFQCLHFVLLGACSAARLLWGEDTVVLGQAVGGTASFIYLPPMARQELRLHLQTG